MPIHYSLFSFILVAGQKVTSLFPRVAFPCVFCPAPLHFFESGSPSSFLCLLYLSSVFSFFWLLFLILYTYQQAFCFSPACCLLPLLFITKLLKRLVPFLFSPFIQMPLRLGVLSHNPNEVHQQTPGY